jgi:hypothetical protein
MQSGVSLRLRQAVVAACLVLALSAVPAAAQSLFGRRQVTVEFATADGKPIGDAEVRVFAPGRPDRPVLTGRTDKAGKFEFAAEADGMWTAEARSGGEIARVMVRVGGKEAQEPLSPYWLVGGLLLLLILAFGFRIARTRARRPPGRG